MRFRKKGGRKREWIGRWKGVKIEEVREFKYLGYEIQANEDQKAYIRHRIKKPAGIMKQIWGIGKRRFKKHWKTRMWLFDTLDWPVIGYGAYKDELRTRAGKKGMAVRRKTEGGVGRGISD